LKVAFVLKGYPRLSETFIAQEIAALEHRGLDIHIVSLRRPADARRHPVHDEIRAKVLYLPEYLLLEPLRVLSCWWQCRKKDSYRKTFQLWWRDLRRDPTPNRVRRFGQALVLGAELPEGVTRLHAHFLHTPASVARYAAALLGLPWTASAHAKDIWTTPEWEKREKLADCEWLVTCTAVNRAHLAALAPAGRVTLVYHGIDLARFPQPPARLPSPGPARLLSVCRLVEKKGMDVLLEALALLPRELDWKLVHVGGGPLAGKLKRLSEHLDISGKIEWHGALAQPALLEQYRRADLFVLASRIARDGDRDGIPNVLAEAQSQGLACVATRVSAIPELVGEGTGLLVEPGDAAALSGAIAALLRDPARRAALGRAAQAALARDFQLEPNLDRLAAKFDLPPRADRVLRTA
jgi:glycosyltransferase involved in cell wall biosynthesis